MFRPFSLLICVIAFVGLSLTQAQAQCEPDSIILDSTSLVLPLPSAVGGAPTLAPACLTQAYSQLVTIAVPDTFTFQGTSAPLDRVQIAQTGGITNLPAGITYTCNPPTCVFENSTLGCIQLSGVTTANPQIYELQLAMKISIVGLPFPVDLQFPGTLAPNARYYLEVKPAGQCASSANDLNSQITNMKSTPNPFGNQTTITVDVRVNGRYTFEVFNVLGQAVHSEQVQLGEGINQILFEASDLANGTYFYSVGNAEGRATRTFVIQR
jgi:hypothetical protein